MKKLALSFLVAFLGMSAFSGPGGWTAAAQTSPSFSGIVDRARAIDALETLIIARNGQIVVQRGWRGGAPDRATNIKSASKSILSALVGIAIDKGVLTGVDQPIAPILRDRLPQDPDPRMEAVTIGHLLSMQAGLGRTSGPNYGAWVASRDWVRAALARPFENDPGSGMLYSTGSTHLLSAILTQVTGRSTLDLAREWLAPVEGFRIAGWDRDPAGIYLGGNQMAMTPRSLLAFGELYRNAGKVGDRQVVPASWIEASWQVRTQSVFSGESYGYNWFLTEVAGYPMRYAWGYGGQMLYIVPDLGLTVVMTSSADQPSARTGHRDALHGLMEGIVREAAAGRGGSAG